MDLLFIKNKKATSKYIFLKYIFLWPGLRMAGHPLLRRTLLRSEHFSAWGEVPEHISASAMFMLLGASVILCN